MKVYEMVTNLKSACFEFMVSVSSEAVCHKIGPALWKIGSTDFVKMCNKR